MYVRKPYMLIAVTLKTVRRCLALAGLHLESRDGWHKSFSFTYVFITIPPINRLLPILNQCAHLYNYSSYSPCRLIDFLCFGSLGSLTHFGWNTASSSSSSPSPPPQLPPKQHSEPTPKHARLDLEAIADIMRIQEKPLDFVIVHQITRSHSCYSSPARLDRD